MNHTWNTRFLLLCSISLVSIMATAQQQIPFYNSGDLVEKGIAEHDKGNFAKALDWYRKVPEGDTNYLLSLYEQSLTLSADTHYRESIALAREALDEGYSDRRQLLLNIANAYDALDQEQEAVTLYDSLARLYPNDNRPYYEKSVIYLKKKEYPVAERLLQQSLLRNPSHFRSHYMLGSVYALQGRLTEAMMALQAALICTNDAALANGPIDMLSTIALQSGDIAELYADKKPEHAHPLYDEIDEIIHARLALNKGYELKTSIDDNIVRQIQVIMEKLRYDSKDTTFSMQYYVPLLKDIYAKDLFEAYVLLLFSDYGIESIDKMAAARKGKAKLEDIRSLVHPYFNTIMSTRELNYNNRQTAPEQYHYFPKDNLLVTGRYTDKTNEKFAEGMVRYYQEQALVGEGRYNAQGTQEGVWNSYYSSGKPRLKEVYNNGKLQGDATAWYENGNIRYKIRYNNEGIVAERQNYEHSGRLTSRGILKGKDDYEMTYYHPDGSVMRVLRLVKDEIKDGQYTILHPNGKVRKEMSYRGGKQDGPCKIYYESGNLKETYTYKDDKLEGMYRSQYEDGKTEATCGYLLGKKHGPFEDFHENGTLYAKGAFKNGKEDGAVTYYTKEGKPFGTVTYRDGIAVAARYTTPDGKTVFEKEDPKGISVMEYFNVDGSPRSRIPIDSKGMVTGKASYYYPSGLLKEETQYVEDVQEGASVSYHKNGKISARHQYKKGTEDGYYQSYFSSGQLRTEGWMKEGEGQGTWHNYGENGKLNRDFFLLDDKLNGPEKNYEMNGKLDHVKKYDYGMIVGITQYDSTGKVLQDVAFDRGNGAYSLLYFNGKPGMQCTLKNGQLDGPFTTLAPNGKLLEQGAYQNGRKSGENLIYYPNGKLRFKGVYKNGQRTGTWIAYDPMGTIESETGYLDGAMEGEDRFYTGGTLRYVTTYHNDNKEGTMTVYGEDQKRAGILYFDRGALTGYTYEGTDGKLLPVIPVQKGTAAVHTFYAGGAKAMVFNFVHNYYEGNQQLYYSNGQLAEERDFADGDYNGTYNRFNPDGSKLMETRFTKDTQQGKENKYDNKGQLLSSATFVDGQPNGPAKIIDAQGKDMINLWYYYGTLQ